MSHLGDVKKQAEAKKAKKKTEKQPAASSSTSSASTSSSKAAAAAAAAVPSSASTPMVTAAGRGHQQTDTGGRARAASTAALLKTGRQGKSTQDVMFEKARQQLKQQKIEEMREAGEKADALTLDDVQRMDDKLKRGYVFVQIQDSPLFSGWRRWAIRLVLSAVLGKLVWLLCIFLCLVQCKRAPSHPRSLLLAITGAYARVRPFTCCALARCSRGVFACVHVCMCACA